MQTAISLQERPNTPDSSQRAKWAPRAVEAPLSTSNQETGIAYAYADSEVIVPSGGAGARLASRHLDTEQTSVGPTSMGQTLRQPAASPVIRLPVSPPLPYTFELRQQWEGVVTDIGDDEITVTLKDLTNAAGPELEVDLPREEVSADDLPLLKKGAILYWSIGYEQSSTGQRKRVSILRFRRLQRWSRKDLKLQQRRLAELDELFGE